jgi:hypothetical protein
LKIAGDQLDGDPAAKVRVIRQVDCRHASPPDLRLNFIPANSLFGHLVVSMIGSQ